MMEDRQHDMMHVDLFYGFGCGHVLHDCGYILELGPAPELPLVFPLRNPFELLKNLSTKLFIDY